MFIKIFTAAILVFFQTNLYAKPTIDELFKAEVSNASAIDEKLKTSLADKQIVFVTGILNEIAFNYFWDFKKCLKKNWGISDSVLIKPPSKIAAPDNVELLHDEFIRSYNLSNKPLVIITHSKGAIETFLTLMKYPQLITDGVVERFIAINGAFKGSHIADYLKGEESISTLDIHKEMLQRYFPGLWVLGKKETIKEVNDVMNTVNANDQKKVSEILYFVRTKGDKSHTESYMLAPNIYLQKKYGDNDGLLLLDEQEPYGLGKDLGTIDEIDHVDLVVSYPFTTTSVHKRYAFLNVLLKQVFGY